MTEVLFCDNLPSETLSLIQCGQWGPPQLCKVPVLDCFSGYQEDRCDDRMLGFVPFKDQRLYSAVGDHEIVVHGCERFFRV